MTKIQVRFKLDNALDEHTLEQISAAQAIYGVEWIRLNPSMTGIEVEYDATRLRPPEILAALKNHGLAVEKI